MRCGKKTNNKYFFLFKFSKQKGGHWLPDYPWLPPWPGDHLVWTIRREFWAKGEAISCFFISTQRRSSLRFLILADARNRSWRVQQTTSSDCCESQMDVCLERWSKCLSLGGGWWMLLQKSVVVQNMFLVGSYWQFAFFIILNIWKKELSCRVKVENLGRPRLLRKSSLPVDLPILILIYLPGIY